MMKLHSPNLVFLHQADRDIALKKLYREHPLKPKRLSYKD